ncbi:MAG: MBOAT family O-acyltransferase [Sumerlaeia bacterium]
MIFPEPAFLYFFLPILLFIYTIIPKSGKNGLLLLFSLFFYAWGEGAYIVIMVFSILWNFQFGKKIDQQVNGSSAANNTAKRTLALAVAGNLALLGFFKYTAFFVHQVNDLLLPNSVQLTEPTLHLPIGISFFTFQAISYIVDVYRRQIPAQKNLLNLGLYISFFPQLIAGPIVRYQTIAAEIENRTVSLGLAALGVRIFILGLAKKVLLANTFAYAADQIFALPSDSLSTSLAWLAIVCYALQIYYDFSGYSDMAIGLGKMFGFNFPENFRTPYAARSMRDFWRRWHITLSTWFRDYLYIPLGGNRGSGLGTSFNLIVVFFLCGLWHGAGINFILWGLYHGVFLALERLPVLQGFVRVPRLIQHVYVIFIFLMGWVLFRVESLELIMNFYQTLFGFGAEPSVLYPVARYMQNDLMIALIIGVVCSAPVGAWAKCKLASLSNGEGNLPRVVLIVFDFVLLGLLLLCMIRIAAQQYSPFIYYRF